MKIKYIWTTVFSLLFLLILVSILYSQKISIHHIGTVKDSDDSIEGYVNILNSYEESSVLNIKDFPRIRFY